MGEIMTQPEKEVEEPLPPYTAAMRFELQEMADREFNRRSLNGGWPFPLLPERGGRLRKFLHKTAVYLGFS